MRRTSLAALLLLAACQRDAAPSGGVADAGAPSGSGLERAAIAAGVVADVSRVSPVGLYQRRHEAGRDLLCVLPGKNGEFRFGAEAIFGAQERCRGHGSARRTGDKLILSFARSDRCIIVAQYDGDQIALPGVVDLKCADLCEGRGSLEGVSFPRIAADAGAALKARDRDGEVICGSE
ncbi:hypothetical protein WG907_12675 [Sphingobium sp. AN558]|uniref:hypothetical protein n=1 Tax=Sphingobium sp. AN558 TaxID=3133442 RepID=UPI0030BE1396